MDAMTWEEYRNACQSTKLSHLHLKYQEENFIALGATNEARERTVLTANIDATRGKLFMNFSSHLLGKHKVLLFRLQQDCCWQKMLPFQLQYLSGVTSNCLKLIDVVNL